MAGDWLKIEAATPDKPEVFEIGQQLKMPTPEVFGRLFLVWRLFDQHTEDGNDNAGNVTSAYIDHVAGVSGFADAMESVGWLSRGTDGCGDIKVPNFDRHNGKTAKSRALTAKRVATHKQRSTNARVTVVPLPREEKRREETTTKTPPPYSGAFLRFWGVWPKGERKRSQGACWDVWRRKDFDQVAESILSHVELLKASEGWRKGFVPAPLVYLNQRQWEGAEMAPAQERTVAL
jgi:hypothetical protein